jgi:hypothetical protein
VSEDRNKHDRAGGKESPLGHKVGKGTGRRVEAEAGMGNYIPDKVRAKVDGTEVKTKPKGGKGKAK